MKIKVRMLRGVIFTTLLSLILSIIVGISIIDLFDKGDQDRNSGRINSAISRVYGEVDKLKSVARSISASKSRQILLESQYNIENSEEVSGLDNIINNDRIETKLIFNSDFSIDKKIISQKVSNEDLMDIERIIEIARQEAENGRYLEGLYGGEHNCFVVISSPIRGDNGISIGTVLLVDILDSKFISDLGNSMQRNLNIVQDIDDDGKVTQVPGYGAVTIIVEKPDEVKAYREINVIKDSKKYYLEQIDVRVVHDQAISNLTLLILMLFIVQIVVNTFLYKLINKKVVNRVVDMNQSVNNIIKSNNTKNRIHEDSLNDEITILSKDINEMLSNIDISKSKLEKSAEELKFIANYDVLTKIHNRYFLIKQINSLISNQQKFTAYFIDLDNFKGINDTAGHNSGDVVICNVANVLKEFQNESVIVGRLGGDEFLLIKIWDNNHNEVNKLAQLINEKINSVISFGGLRFTIKSSIGASLYPEHGKTTNEILQYADIAMYKAKKSLDNRFYMFDNTMLEETLLGAKFERAIENDKVVPYYQPIYDVNSSKIIGAEALARLEYDGKIITPYKFIDIAKSTGAIVKLDEGMLRNAARYCKLWVDKGIVDFQISINISYMFLNQDSFEDKVKSILDENNLSPSNIKLEITEDEIIYDISAAIKILEKLRAIGIKVSLDDFGTGYSSFNYMKILPLDTIKIDKSLLDSIEHDDKSKYIINTLISLCHNLGLNVVCEGVEEQGQLKILQNLKCNMIQGYIISPPLPDYKFDKLVEKYNNM